MNDVKLEKCPFCNSENIIYTDSADNVPNTHCVYCGDCGCGTATYTGCSPHNILKNMAIEAWNRRVNNETECKVIMGRALLYIDEAPTIDAEPVKHGEWEDVKFSEGVFKDNDDSDDIGISITSAKCSLCQRYSERLQQYRPQMPTYCSHCGAKMDGESAEDEKV